MSGKLNTYKKAKNTILKRGCSVAELKQEFRKHFNNRIKDIRHSLLDSNRTLTDEDVAIIGYEELHGILLPENEDLDLLEPNTAFQALNEVLQEESQMLVEDGEKILEDEMDAILEDL